jgi:3-oxoacyl-[acyl-carrier-protein] synthase II
MTMLSHVDHLGRPLVVVTGMGVVTSLGAGKNENWRRLTRGESGIRRISRFSTKGMKTQIAGSVDFVPAEPPCLTARCENMAMLVAEEALDQAAIGTRGDFPGPLFLAIPPAEVNWPQRIDVAAALAAGGDCNYDALLAAARHTRFAAYHHRLMSASVADSLSDAFGTKGSPISVQTACASGAVAIQLAVEAIRRHETDAALCVGTDGSVTPEAVIRFSLLSALSTRNDPAGEAARPFAKDRDGFVMAEGAGALVLESLGAARARGARILGVLAGCGEKSDSFHLTRSSPDGKAIITSIERAIADAGVEREAIGYINAHGTGTPENDKMECLGVMTVFGDRASAIPISSNKSMIGHTLSAAGAVEAVFTLLTMESGRIPPTINYHTPDPAIPLDVVPNVARDVSVRHAISNSFGFGGQNVSLVLSREPA